jgi:hypothetical protein
MTSPTSPKDLRAGARAISRQLLASLSSKTAGASLFTRTTDLENRFALYRETETFLLEDDREE